MTLLKADIKDSFYYPEIRKHILDKSLKPEQQKKKNYQVDFIKTFVHLKALLRKIQIGRKYLQNIYLTKCIQNIERTLNNKEEIQ